MYLKFEYLCDIYEKKRWVLRIPEKILFQTDAKSFNYPIFSEGFDPYLHEVLKIFLPLSISGIWICDVYERKIVNMYQIKTENRN